MRMMRIANKSNSSPLYRMQARIVSVSLPLCRYSHKMMNYLPHPVPKSVFYVGAWTNRINVLARGSLSTPLFSAIHVVLTDCDNLRECRRNWSCCIDSGNTDDIASAQDCSSPSLRLSPATPRRSFHQLKTALNHDGNAPWCTSLGSPNNQTKYPLPT